MKKFLKILLVFFIPILAVGVSMEVLLRKIPNSYRYKSEYLVTHKDEIETLLLGSSHTLYDLNPAYFDSHTFNAGQVSQTLDIDKKILEHYIDSLPKLKTVILRLSYTTLFEKLGKTNEDWRLKNYTIYTPVNVSNKLAYHFEVLSVKLKNNVDELNTYYVKQEDVINWSDLGWGTKLSVEKKVDLQRAGQRAADRHTIEDHRLLTSLKATLEDFIESCEQRNIQVILFTPPAYQSYRDHLDVNQYTIMEATGKEMEDKFDNCRYVNYMDSVIFETEDFFDADHLNPKGAKKLSTLLNTLAKNNTPL